MRSALIGLAILCLATPLAAQTLQQGRPEDVGMSSERMALIGSVLNREVEEGRIPGAVVAIARRGRLVYHEAFGFRDKAAGAPMTRDVIFPIASLTKPIVAVGTMILQEEGRLAVSDPIAQYLPELADRVVAVSGDGSTRGTVPARRQPTLQDLLRHTPGFPAHRAGTLTAQQFIDSLARLPLQDQPGTKWAYRSSFEILGLAIERVTGQSLGQYLEARVFRPLGMDDTGFLVPAAKSQRYAVALPNNPLTGRPQSIGDLRNPRWGFECGGGCLASTAEDYLTFAQMLLNGGRSGEVRILGVKTVQYMVSDHIGPDVDVSSFRAGWPLADGYGFGLSVAVRRGDGVSGMIGSAGDYHWGGATGTYFWVDPKEDLAVVFMAAAPGALRMRYRHLLPTLVYQAIVTRGGATLAPPN